MRQVLFIIIVLLVPCGWLWSQEDYITGRVTDSVSHEPLAFVSIVYNAAGQGVVTNTDGIFRIPRSGQVQFLKFRYVGYRQKTLPYHSPGFRNNLQIMLSPEPYGIAEVIVYPTENPAHRIIKLASENRNKNNPEKTGPFSYVSYDKIIFGIDPDTAMRSVKQDSSATPDIPLPDSLPFGMDRKGRIDAQRFLEKQYMFMMETVSSRKYLSPEKNKEEIIASKVSGLSQPSFVVMARQLQSFSFYDDFVGIANRKFLNPISAGSTDKYFFLIQDTVFTERNDTVFVISFRPWKGRNFDGMKGVLYINSNGYAVQNVLAEAYDVREEPFTVSIQQQYEYIESTRWFPVLLTTTVRFDASRFGANAMPLNLIGTGKSYIVNINFNPVFTKDEFSNVELEISPDAHKQPEQVWNAYRVDSLSSRERETYRVIDSLGKAEHLDRTIYSFETLLTGYLPGKYWNFDLRRFVDYTAYEGFRFGAGGRTTSQVSRLFSLEAYLAYSLRDEAFKYGGSLTTHLWPVHKLDLTLLYRDDVRESGGIRFNEPWSLTGSAFIRNYMVEVMDIAQEASVSLSFLTLKYLTAQPYLIHSILTPTNGYGYSISDENPEVLLTQFYLTETGIRLRYALQETFMKTPRGNEFSMGTRFPVIYVNLSKGLDVLRGDFSYWRFDFKVTKVFTTKTFGDTRLALVSGLVSGDTPYSRLYAGMASYKTFTLEAEQSFGAMRFNEFLSDRFLALFIKQDFGKLLFKPRGKFQPEIALVQGFGIGTLQHPEPHENITFSTMEKGYFESGLLINNLLRFQLFRYGLGVLYRYGPYAFGKTIDNFAFKLTLQLNR
jgi:hypothetical protein